ncbi:MAG: VC0807 family protein [Jatrophihabitans sp.]
MTWVAHLDLEPDESGSARSSRASSRAVVRMMVEFGVPVAMYYGLRAASVDVFSALLIGAVVSAAIAAAAVIRHRRLDGMSAYVTAIMVGGVGISLLAGSTQFLLARGALLTGITGLWFLASLWGYRPLTYLFSQPLLEGRFRWPQHWDDLWERSPRFRRMWRVSSALWGLGTLMDAALRVVMAYTLAPDLVPALGTILYAGTSVVLIAVTTIYYAASGIYNPSSALYAPLGIVKAAT